MTNPVGGARLRLIKMSVFNEIQRCITDLGYMSPSWHGQPVTVSDEPFNANTEIVPNVVFISAEGLNPRDWEMGSTLQYNEQTFYADIFAESEEVVIQLAGDVMDIVRGKMPDIGRSVSGFTILDYRLATPTPLFDVEVWQLDYQPAKDWNRQFNKFYTVVGFDVRDWF